MAVAKVVPCFLDKLEALGRSAAAGFRTVQLTARRAIETSGALPFDLAVLQQRGILTSPTAVKIGWL